MIRTNLGMFILAAAMVFPPFVLAEQEVDFDQTVKELRSSLKDEPVKAPEPQSQLEMGAALVGGYMSVGDNGSPTGSTIVNGFDLHVGVDLYATKWLAEGAFRSFGSQTFSRDYSAAESEFDLTLVHQSDLQKNWQLRVGGGFSASFLHYNDNRGGGASSGTDQAPGVLALLGVERLLGNKVTVGPDLEYHAPLLQQTALRSSVDASIRINYRF